MDTEKVQFEILRYDPEKGGKPQYQKYVVEVTHDMSVLDAINKIKDEQDGSLTYRWSCRMAICGSCSMKVNGLPMLVCENKVSSIKQRPILVEPMSAFPVIKDLVVDISKPFEKMRNVSPFIERDDLEDVSKEYKMSPKQLNLVKQTGQCIKCMLCYSACPVYAENKQFVGPAASALAYKYQADVRDKSSWGRLDPIGEKHGVWDCSFIGECSVVCPKKVDPALAIQRLKVVGMMAAPLKLIKIGEGKKK